MADSDSCARCGGPLIDAHCQACERHSESTFVHREIVVLVVLSTLVAVGFVLTREAAGANRAHRLRDAAAWYDAGERYLAGGQPEPAIRALRRATAIDRDSRTYRLALAGGLAADRQDDAARQVLLGVRETSPEDPEVNVRLARLEARHDDVTGTVPVAVSLVTGALLAWVFPDVRGSGVPQTEAAYHLQNGVIPGRVPFGKFITGVLCIGSGHSMGREGPSVQIGAGLASVVGRWVPLSTARVKDLVPVGAAGALAAASNTPLAAVLLALEEIIGDMNATLLGSTVVASVASVVVERSILGNEPLVRVPAYHLQHPNR